MTQEAALGEGEVGARVEAAETLKAAVPDTWVGVSLSDENRSFEPWVLNAKACRYTLPFGCYAFSPLHQRPTSPMGQMGVEAGHVVVGATCPGMFRGIFHAGGDKPLQEWAIRRKAELSTFLVRERVRVVREINERDVVSAHSAIKPSEEQIDAIIDHLKHFRDSLEDWEAKITAEDLGLAPRMEGLDGK